MKVPIESGLSEELLDLISKAIASVEVTPELAKKIFYSAEKVGREADERWKATIPTWKDRLREYTI